MIRIISSATVGATTKKQHQCLLELVVAAFAVAGCGDAATGSDAASLARPDHTTELLSLRSVAVVAEHRGTHTTRAVFWVKRSGMKGSIERTDDGPGEVHQYHRGRLR